MVIVRKDELRRGEFYLAYVKAKVSRERTRKMLYLFCMGQYSDAVIPTQLFTIDFYNPADPHAITALPFVKTEVRTMPLGDKITYFSLTSSEFLMHTLGESI